MGGGFFCAGVPRVPTPGCLSAGWGGVILLTPQFLHWVVKGSKLRELMFRIT